jgi:hypothetical protein
MAEVLAVLKEVLEKQDRQEATLKELMSVMVVSAKTGEKTLEKVGLLRVGMAAEGVATNYNQVEINELFPLTCDCDTTQLENRLNAEPRLANRLVSLTLQFE